MGEPDEFIALYERDAEAVLVFLARRTIDPQAALDLTAETFAQAWRGWCAVRTESREEVRAWLFTIARRQLSHYYRRGSAERRALQRVGMEVPALGPDDLGEIERAAGLAALRARVRGELSRLSERQRAAVELRIVQELPYGEVARRLGTTEATARARVSRGLRALAVALEAVASEEVSTPA